MTFFFLLQVMKDQLEIYPSHQRSPKSAFQDDAIENHPLSFILFVKPLKEECYEVKKKFKYSVCDYTGKFKNNLKRHIQFVPEGKKGIPNKCYVWM